MDPAPKRMSTEARRRQLLAFGREHFAQHGFEAMPMDAIAEHAGVSKGLLYHYFGDQRGFYMETVRGVTDEVIATIEPPSDQAFEDAFRTMVTRFVQYVQTHRAIYRALVRGGLGSDTEVNALLDRVRVTSMERILERLGVGEPSSLSRIAIYGWVSLVENSCAEWTEADGVSPDELVELFTSAFQPILEVLN
ncbi:MAG: TetR/AcrR family transcriptional regulator [Myxococcales bacterium]|nr:TetR/AcrR family transcriptional regulator [Deltaproteobacteria bacterium]NNK08456.1 TetR/AcrR family transcriptional regulator [Myxococcales bacterium]NNK44614.1 TetR/AcrR family transcriptional regulator [Myxococcales bacterium]NNL23691.1 TetR/AcrR family transcriptional regulator [Myxococcales bacterium]RZV50131.1 MAG: TetR/AcrR family transcriptional regulator [Deltaproteobacteria bacterium]